MAERVRTKEYCLRFSQLQRLRLPALCLFFLLGIALGHAVAYFGGSDGDLASYLRSIASMEVNTAASVVSVVIVYFRYPLITLLSGFCSFGTIAIPMLLAVQGFTFSFAASSLAVSLGRQGAVLALATIGLRSIIAVFTTLLLSLWALERVAGASDTKYRPNGRAVILCFLILALGVIAEVTIVPKIFSLALTALK